MGRSACPFSKLETDMNFIKIAQRADLVLGIILLAFSGYALLVGHYLQGSLGLLAAGVSLASAKFVPSRWVIKKLMMARLK